MSSPDDLASDRPEQRNVNGPEKLQNEGELVVIHYMKYL